MNRAGLTLAWLVYVLAIIGSVLAGRSAGGPGAVFVGVILDNLSFLVGFAALLTLLVAIAWIRPIRR